MKLPKIPDEVAGLKLWQIIVFGIVAFFAYPFIRAKYNHAKAQSDANQFEEAKHEVPAANPMNPNAQGTVIINTKATANIIYSAFYEDDFYGLFENEGAAITAILKVPKNLVPEVATYYSQKTTHGRSMYADFLKFCNPLQLSLVQQHFDL